MSGRRRVLVTGATKGIGRAVAVAFAGTGARVAIHHRGDPAAAGRTRAHLAGDGHVLVTGDLSDSSRVHRIVDEAFGALGGLDVFVNNAAMAPNPSVRHPVLESSAEHWASVWQGMVDVNLLSAAHLMHAVAGHLVRQGTGGSIVNIGSRGAFRGEPDFPAYGATKAAVHALGQSLAVSLAPHDISVASVAPGFVSSERQAPRLAGPEGDGLRAASPFGRVGTPQEVAAAVLYLASGEARWASGTVLDLNGASYLR
ncbi:SDR family oxidoreductase [Kineosporia mesophila]|uniref:SDR family oxidoreductase n=1 Tax=Kineosporia mesophila TaxID=566012 RepID=A0ABP6ZN90_9ACTN|nr:SDR family oxidoreductase [Kineosporia mesophila]MCD5355107.1 SDR family oxidoreductase [Kineosporia mesophila]